MTQTQQKTRHNPQPSYADLRDELAIARQELEELRQEKEDLELMLEMTTEHSDTVEEELHDKAEAALRTSQQQLRMIIEATPAPVLISRLVDGEIVYANTIAGPLFGLHTQELVGCNASNFYFDATERQALLAVLEEVGRVDSYEVRMKRADGTPLWAEVSLRSLEFHDEPATLAAVHDITHLKQMNEASGRFVPREYLGFLDRDSIINTNLGDHVSGEMTVLFSDLRGFTTVSESMSPQDNFAFVNQYLGRVSPIIRRHNGFIIKYMGDGIQATFPTSPDDAVRAGIEKLLEVNEYNIYRLSKNRVPIAVGIGVNTGRIMVGIIGEEDRMQCDALSDAVNLTARLEGLTKYYGISFIISDATHDRLANSTDYHIRYLDRVQVKGRKNALVLYEVYDADPPQIRALKSETQEEYEEALRLYYAKEFEAAQSKLFSVLQRNPKDRVAWQHLVKATQLAEEGVAEGWTGVTVMTQK